MSKTGRNDPCPCGSGKKFKKCCYEADSPPVSELAVRRLRQAEGRLMERLMDHAEKHYGDASMAEAWGDFVQWEEERMQRFADTLEAGAEGVAAEDPVAEIEALELESLFFPWFLYSWVPGTADEFEDDEDDEDDDVEDPGREAGADGDRPDFPPMPIAFHYAQLRGSRLDPLESRFIDASCNTPFSFHLVLDAVPGQSIRLRDILRGEEVTVQERQSSAEVQDGVILFARVITIDGISIMFGTAPLQFPPLALERIIALRDDILEEEPVVTQDVLFEWSEIVREEYNDLREEMLNPVPPQMHNTDGDTLELSTLYFELRCAPQEAFDALAPLAVGITHEDLLSDAVYETTGIMRAAIVPWLRPGNAGSSSMPNTALAQCRIAGAELQVDVNSRERAAAVRAEVETRLGARAEYRRAVIHSLQQMVQGEGNPGARDSDEDLMHLPEIQQHMQKMREEYLSSWPDTPVPALRGQTPREASRTAVGRELLEALLEEYEHHAEAAGGKPGAMPEVAQLRQALGL